MRRREWARKGREQRRDKNARGEERREQEQTSARREFEAGTRGTPPRSYPHAGRRRARLR